MAEKAEKKPEAAPAAAAAAASAAGGAAAPAGKKEKGGIGGLLGKTPVMLGGVMILEAAVLFAGFKFLGGGPQPVGAGVITDPAADPHNAKDGKGHGDGKSAGAKAKTVELLVLEFKAQNKQSGRTFLYDVAIYIVTRSEFETQVKDTIKAREALIKDRVRTIIAQNDPEKLGGGSEPGLETLRRQVKHQLDEIVGEGLIEEVLVPRCIPFRTDF